MFGVAPGEREPQGLLALEFPAPPDPLTLLNPYWSGLVGE